jgi:hypothetical protein
VKFILPGNGVKLARVEAVNADVNRRQSGITPPADVARQTIAVGGDRNLANRGFSRTAAMMSAKSRRKEGSPPVRRTFLGAERRESARDAAYFINAEKAFVGDGAGFVAIRQAVGATKVAHIGN